MTEPAAGEEGGGEGARLPALDGVRAIAILLVLQYHVVFVAQTLMLDGRPNGFDRLFLRVWSGGWAGVDLFFILSGFLITGILLRAKSGEGYFRVFYARRFLRIFPVYYAFLAFLIFVLPNVQNISNSFFLRVFHIEGSEQLWFWTYTHNIGMAFPRLTDHQGLPAVYLWSLAVEEQFYLLWPLVVLLLSRRLLIPLSIGLILLAPALRIWMTLSDNSWFDYSFVTYLLLPTRIDTLAAGALIACLMHARPFNMNGRAPAAALSLAGLCVLITLGVWRDGLHSTGDDWVRTIGYSALVAFFGGIVFLVVLLPPGSRVAAMLSGKVLAAVGMYSYAMYLFHPLIVSEIAHIFLTDDGLPRLAGSYVPAIIALDLVVILASFAAGWLSWNLLEKHFLKLKRYFPYGASPPAPASRAAAPTLPVPTPDGP